MSNLTESSGPRLLPLLFGFRFTGQGHYKVYCPVREGPAALREPPRERPETASARLYMVAKSNDAGENASTKHKDEAATSERGFSFKKNSTNKALRNVGCEQGCDDNEMMFKIKDQAWTSCKNKSEATEYDEKYEECRQK